MKKFLVATTATLACLSLSGIGPASSATTSQEGKVVRVVDGDTVAVDIWGDGTTTPVSIRNSGLQAMEVGECNSAPATSVMSSVALGKTVRLTAQDSRTTSLGRPVRLVDTKTTTAAGTTYADTQLEVIKRGYALWLTIYPETARALTYHQAMEAAAAQKIGMWNPQACKAGPSQTANLQVLINYDGDGDENAVPNNEWVDVLNKGTTDVPVGGWKIRTGAQDTFTLPAGTVIKPGAVIRLHVGKGTNNGVHFYWGWTTARFHNLDVAPALGGGAYLFDPDGDLRAHSTYPCVYGACTDPAVGKVKISANYDAPGDDMTNPNGEYLTITSLSSTPVDQSWYVVQVGGSTRQFGYGTILKTKGSTIKVYIGKGTSGYTTKYWGKSSAILVNGGGSAVLRTAGAIRIACTAWGTGRC